MNKKICFWKLRTFKNTETKKVTYNFFSCQITTSNKSAWKLFQNNAQCAVISFGEILSLYAPDKFSIFSRLSILSELFDRHIKAYPIFFWKWEGNVFTPLQCIIEVRPNRGGVSLSLVWWQLTTFLRIGKQLLHINRN